MNLKNLEKRTIDEVNSIIQANRISNELTAEELLHKFPHAVKSFKYVNGKLKITLHALPRFNHSN